MPKHKYIESPESLQELPFKKNGIGDYVLFSEGGRNNINKVNANRFPDGYIYFIKIKDQNVYKLGVSRNPKRRLADINSYLPYDFDILSLHFFKDVYDLEGEVTSKIEDKKLKREWFTLTTEEASEIMIYLHNKDVRENGSTNR